MFESTYRLLRFFDEVERVNGRKKLQKMIYLLERAGTDLPYKYEYHYYGPYSAQLQEEVNELVQQGFLEEDHVDEMYIYRITEKGKRFKNALEKNGDFEFDLDGELVEILRQESSTFLEMVSTYAYLLESGYNEEQAKRKAKVLKPHLGDYLDKAVDFYYKIVSKKL